MAEIASAAALSWREKAMPIKRLTDQITMDGDTPPIGSASLSAVGGLAALILGSLAFLSFLLAPIPWPSAKTFELTIAIAALVALSGGLLSLLTNGGPSRALKTCLKMLATGGGLALFAVPLSIAWFQGTNNGGLIGGLIPFSDASGYMTGTWQLLEAGTLNHWNMRRPVNAALHALRWALSGGDLMVSLAITAWLIGLGSLLAATFVRRDLGWAAAVILVLAWLSFVDRWLPLTLSEAHGCLLGIIGFALIWRSATDRHALTFGIGIAVFSVALAARAGPFFMMPALLLWGTLYLGKTYRQRLIVALAGLGGFIAGQSVPRFFNAYWGDGGNALYSNFAHTFYGMTAGGKRWTAIKTEHPELFAKSVESGERAARIYELAIDQLVQSPDLLFGFIWQELNRFSTFFVDKFLVPDLAAPFWSVLIIAGCLWCLIRWRHPLSGLLVAGMVGLWLSSPFLMQDGGARVFAVGVPWIAALLAYGAFAILRIAAVVIGNIRTRARSDDPPPSPSFVTPPSKEPLSSAVNEAWLFRHGPLTVGLLTLIIVVAGPLVAVASFPSINANRQGICPSGQVERMIRPDWSTILLRTVPAATPGHVRVPSIKDSHLREDLRVDRIPFMETVIAATPPFSVMLAYDHTSLEQGRARAFYALKRHNVAPLPKDGVVALCGIETCFECRGGTVLDVQSWQRLDRPFDG